MKEKQTLVFVVILLILVLLRGLDFSSVSLNIKYFKA
jgi:hypothetical protein